MEANTQVQISVAVDPLKDKICEIHDRLQKVENRNTSHTVPNDSEAQAHLQSQINALQSKIVELQSRNVL